LQVTPTQSASEAHVVAHWNGLVASHLLYRPQDVMAAAGQAPLPLQVTAAASIAGEVALPATHDRLRHPWVVPKNWQRVAPGPLAAVLLPAHRPFRPHVMGLATATHTVAGSGSGMPAAMAVQVPVELRHVSQVPLQALVQQTPGVPSSR
jgi:hypothetical protein